ncbi:wax ester/triacylglycerol synthase family O-acyltransferase [Nocardia bovistercoris]|uniref:Diacylglycerol O-acyltransferase n=1 Tax=Nocardia bovistercoris TaxID=2785916 RepID=A0A931N6S8_9NOCA|nr:wax ester/triacylglycerol synthase family O-acyltransferase [Nocardia bovistercoris]MBH0781057.1 wax ester/triacylglycerol synthase family O-acyltransferase [Nocardia bovistercoris]
MTELRLLDSGFIELEDADQHVSAGIGVVAIIAGAPPTRAEFTVELSRRVAADARLRRRVRRTPWDLAAPRWEDDPDFDVARHLRWTAVPRPCDDRALFELVATAMEERLDRDHPLWQCVVVERLDADRWAILVKAHHSMVDGISGIALFQRLCDDPDGTAVRRSRHSTRPGWNVRDVVVKGMRLPVDVPRLLLGTVRAAAPLVVDVVRPAPTTSLNGSIGRRRRYAPARASLTEVKEIGAAFGATVNDVALAALAAAFRALLVHRGEDPTAEEVRVLAPVSTRSPGADSRLGNKVSIMLPVLPVATADPVEQLAAVHAETASHKKSGEAGAADLIITAAGLLPFVSVAWALRLASHFPQHGVACLATNVPGPDKRLFFGGREVLEISPYVPIALRLRTGIGILSYHDQLRFGITGDYDSTPDIELFATEIERAVARLLKCARDLSDDQPRGRSDEFDRHRRGPRQS